jgi:HAD superfamily hydrolase (TIGR01549 family)
LKYKALLLDIDNTLYSYEYTHQIALNSVIDYCKLNFNIDKNSILNAYKISRQEINQILINTASSHNRMLYFQKMLELLDINSLEHTIYIYELYWKKFLDNMIVYDCVYELCEKYSDNICLITDLTAHIQHRKIQKLHIQKYCKYVVTSEESGIEKPNSKIFEIALQKLDLDKNEVCMIGDSFQKDIMGACNNNIKSIWLNSNKELKNYDKTMIKEVESFKDILEYV